MLRSLDIDFENTLSLVIGRNNSGKTSLLVILQKFLAESKPEFAFEDFSLETQQEILNLEGNNQSSDEYNEVALSLKLAISYMATDNLGTASKLLLDLDSTKNHLVILFEYVLTYEKYLKLVAGYTEYKAKGINRSFEYYLNSNLKKFFDIRIQALEYENEDNSKLITSEIVHSIISLQTIGAKRDVDNEQGKSKSLSSLAGRYYAANIASDSEFPELQQQLSETDKSLSGIYKGLFAPIIKEIAEMSYNPKEAELAILSTLSEKRIFQDNTTVKYKHEDTLLPEDYNGLGYLNLFAIIFNIRIKLNQLAKKDKTDENPTPLNLLFVEEPEAHTHPQMQYVFIKNIKKILEKYRAELGQDFSLQTIISTHSSHIVSQCDFQDIKYFYRENHVSVKSRSLKNLYSKMVNAPDGPTKIEQERAYRFVKQYVTLNRAELFFADKAVLIEGDTERMLFSAMMKKADDEEAVKVVEAKKIEGEEKIQELETQRTEPLLSQNISVIQVGAYSHIFATFLGFLEIKTLIVTDLDCSKPGANGKLKKCKYTEGTSTSNASIKFFTQTSNLADIVTLATTPITLSYDDITSMWNFNSEGQLRLLFQKEENGYQARSFEDAFLCNNLQFVINNEDSFSSLKNRTKLTSMGNDFYGIADECIGSKTAFALDVLLYGGENNEKWSTPLYIKEGLEWLAH
jgi:predicted ATP-dependent endonuclease of OLD family